MKAPWRSYLALATLGAACHEHLEVLDSEREPPGGAGGTAAPSAGRTAGQGGMEAEAGTQGEEGGHGGRGSAGASSGAPPDPVLGGSLDAGDAHTCATRQGILYCWGNGDSGRLGVGDEDDRGTPVRVGDDADWVAVVTGVAHTCALKSDGEVYCFGANDQGQLGRTGVAHSLTPRAVELPEAAELLSSGSNHACTISSTGSLTCWGYNIEGGLGLGDTHPGLNQFAPVASTPYGDWLTVGTGQGHTCGVRREGSLWGWGRNTAAQLGLGSTSDLQRREATVIGEETLWSKVVSGQDASCGIQSSGALFCWGGNEFGTLGLGDREQRLSPTAVDPERVWDHVSIDTFHGCGIDSEAKLYCWGRNVEGQLGTGDDEDRLSPTLVGEGYRHVAAGRFHTCAETEDQRVLCTGKNVEGWLGFGHQSRVDTFTEVAFPE